MWLMTCPKSCRWLGAEPNSWPGVLLQYAASFVQPARVGRAGLIDQCVCVHARKSVLLNLGTPECTYLCKSLCIWTYMDAPCPSVSVMGASGSCGRWLARLVWVRTTPVHSSSP